MQSMSTDRRHPAGTPAGGRFASTPRAEADTSLVDAQAAKVQERRTAYIAAIELLAQADVELVEHRVRERWPEAAALRMRLGPDDDWGVVGIVDDRGVELADWHEAGLRDVADIGVSLFELNDLGRLAPLVRTESPDDVEGLWHLPQRSATHS